MIWVRAAVGRDHNGCLLLRPANLALELKTNHNPSDSPELKPIKTYQTYTSIRNTRTKALSPTSNQDFMYKARGGWRRPTTCSPWRQSPPLNKKGHSGAVPGTRLTLLTSIAFRAIGGIGLGGCCRCTCCHSNAAAAAAASAAYSVAAAAASFPRSQSCRRSWRPLKPALDAAACLCQVRRPSASSRLLGGSGQFKPLAWRLRPRQPLHAWPPAAWRPLQSRRTHPAKSRSWQDRRRKWNPQNPAPHGLRCTRRTRHHHTHTA